ncbi:MAG: DUF2190 family protein [Candidatus Bathyarchaeia archaeon]
MSYDAQVAGNIFCLPGDVVAFTAGANITKGQIVKVTGNMTVQPATAATDAVIGVAVSNANSGGSVSVLMGCPVVWVTAGGTISAGAAVGATTNGAAAAVSTAGNRAVGFALEGGSSGNVIRVALSPHVY